MKSINLLYIISFIFLGCGVSQSEYEKLKQENEKLKDELYSKNIELEKLNESTEIVKEIVVEPEPERVISYSESDAMKYLMDYYEFYNADMIYRNPRVRRVNGNTFNISLQVCSKDETYSKDEFFWVSQVHTLKIKEDGTYDIY